MTRAATTSDEKPVFFAAGNETLFGILTRPTSESNGRVVIFLPGGGHASLTRRIPVRLSRRLAAMGFHTFRFDYHGVGESSGEIVGYRLDEPFVEDLSGAVRWLRAQGFERFILVGHCFGARTALACAHQIEGLERLLLVNLHPRDLKRGEGAVTLPDTWTNLDIVRRAARADVLRSLLDAQKRRSYRRSLLEHWQNEMRRVRARIAPSRSDGIASRLLLDPLARVIDLKLPILLIFDEDNRSYRDFVEARRGSLGRLLGRASEDVRVKTLEGRGLQEVDGQKRILDIFVSELEGAESSLPVG